MAEQNIASAVAFKVKIGGSEVEENYLISWHVNQDLNQPDMARVTLRNEDNSQTGKYKIGDAVEVTAGASDDRVFKGELVGLENNYRADGNNTCTVRAFNKLHRLLRGRKSKTFVKQSDKDIIGVIAGEHGLSPKVGSDAGSPKHEHVYQHNQTDLEFLRLRAARAGYEVWVDDTDLYVDKPDPAKDSGIKLRYGDAQSSHDGGAVFLKSFTPRMSTAGIVAKVTVRGWDPQKKQEIIGVVEAKSSKLGKSSASNEAKKGFGAKEHFEVDQPIFSVDEAKKIAGGRLDERSMSFITGDGECRGTPGIKPGVVVTVTVNEDDSGDLFNGKYLVVGATHMYTDRGSDGGYITRFRFTRDAWGG